MSEPVFSSSVTNTGLSFFTDDNARANIEAITKVYLDIFQDIETAIQAVYNSRQIDNATNAQLDLIGALVGQARGNFTDAEYRSLVRAKILVNRSDGTSRAIADIMAALIKGTSISGVFTDTSNMKWQASFTNYSLSADLMAAWKTLLEQAKALGSGDDIVYVTAPKAGALVWCAVADMDTTTSVWDDVADTLAAGDWSAVA